MVIAINTRCLNKDELVNMAVIICEVFQQDNKFTSGHTFIFIFDKPFKTVIYLSKECDTCCDRPTRNNPAKWYIWYNIKIPLLLKKYKADVFVSYELLLAYN